MRLPKIPNVYIDNQLNMVIRRCQQNSFFDFELAIKREKIDEDNFWRYKLNELYEAKLRSTIVNRARLWEQVVPNNIY